MAVGDIMFDGDVKNSNNSVIFSKYGDIVIDSQNVNLNGLVYAPFGEVVVTGQNINLNSVIIIANKITFNCPNVNANSGNEMAKFVGNVSEKFHIPYAEWEYLQDSDGDGVPDFIADYENWQYLLDTDGDWLPDCIEEYLGSDMNLTDTDGDELPDGYEFFVTVTDCTLYDSLGEGLSDGEYDFDEDGLNNKTEYNIGTRPDEKDYDYDGLNDGDEVNCYGTDPMKGDTDEEGLKDGDEIVLGTSPLVQDTDGNGILDCDEKFTQKYVYEESDTASVIDEVIIQMNATGNIQKTTTVESMKGKDPLCEDVVGLVGSPYSIETESVFDTATISFKVDMSQLNEKTLDDYIVLWYDEENYTFVEMETKYDEANGLISTETTHFSRYMIVDADAWFDAWSEELNYTNTEYEESRVYTVLAVDCSGSMSSSDPITSEPKSKDSSYYYNNCKRYEAVSNYVKAMDSDDKASIVTFDNYAYAECAMTDDKIVLTNAAEGFYNGGGTSYDNALKKSIEILNNSEGSTRKKIVLLSDGQSSVSDSIIESAKTSNIKIYTIGLGNSSDSVLQYIADETGGQFFKAYTADELLDIYDEIGVTVEVDTTDLDEDELYDVYEVAGIRLQNGKIIYTDPTEDDTDGDGLLDGEEINPVMQHDEVYYPTGVPLEKDYFIMYSNPGLKDSDEDEILDLKDIQPLIYNNYPDLFVKYINHSMVEMDMVRQDENNFTIMLEPLSKVCEYYGIDYLEAFETDGVYDDLTVIFNDWYIYAIPNEDEWTYSIIKIRTSHSESGVGVSIPFRGLDTSLFSNADRSRLSTELDEIIYMHDYVDYDESIRGFWANANNTTNYYLADLYIALIIQNDCINNTINIQTYRADQKEFLEQHPTIYDEINLCLYINDVSNLSLEERQCILVSHSGNPSYNSFAAEVVAHAWACGLGKIYGLYEHVNKADMGVGEEKDDITDDTYINYNGHFVKEQRNLFGDF